VCPVHCPRYAELADAVEVVGVEVVVDPAVLVGLADDDDPVAGGLLGESFAHPVIPAINPSAMTPVAAQRFLFIIGVPLRQVARSNVDDGSW
jgi:hypothetical protein